MMHKTMKGANDEDEANKLAASETDSEHSNAGQIQPHPGIPSTTMNAPQHTKAPFMSIAGCFA